MFTYEIIGFSFISSKDLFVLHLKYLQQGTEGYAVEVCFCKKGFIEGGSVKLGSLCKIYRNQKGFCIGVEII